MKADSPAVRRRAGAESGFTLIEITVVLVILVLAYAVAAPMLSNLIGRPGIDGAVEAVGRSLKEARGLAIARVRDVRFQVTPDRRGWRYGDRSGAAPEGTEVVPAGDGAPLVFHSDGSSTGGRLTVRRGDETRTVTVDWLTGRIAAE